MPMTSTASPTPHASFGVLAGWETLENRQAAPRPTPPQIFVAHEFGVELFDATRVMPVYLEGSSGGGAACCCCSCSSSGARESQ